MSDDLPPPVERHAAQDRVGKRALRTAHDLGAALADDGADAEPVVLRTDGPHVSFAGLAALIDEALAEDAAARRAGRPADAAEPSGPRAQPQQGTAGPSSAPPTAG
ncbi:MAG TPA: hypothetical protein VHF92_19320 [Geodermatophilus sp.]|nr:hypothetical protein [Geodermatophilus sp.]